jgi:hypothetical protein
VLPFSSSSSSSKSSSFVCSLKGMESAIKGRHGSKIKDREISVKEAIPEDKIPPGGRQRDRYRGSYGGGSR